MVKVVLLDYQFNHIGKNGCKPTGYRYIVCSKLKELRLLLCSLFRLALLFSTLFLCPLI
uniref:Uncharacterized protein n=1 Tax=Arundo donax TaxID=35708 RepID=A0A0A9GV97_ARUDO